jgi:hypothetical protein
MSTSGANVIKQNYEPKALGSVINYDHKRDATVWIVNLWPML